MRPPIHGQCAPSFAKVGEAFAASFDGDARAVARLFALLTDAAAPIISQALLGRAIEARWDGVEAMTQRHFRYGLGFMLDCPPLPLVGPRNFGHPGIGGPLGFGDPERRLGFGYACNRMAPVADIGPARAMIEAAYDSLT